MEPAVELAPATVETPLQHRILVADDDVGQTQVLAYSLRKQGYQVSVAHSGTACLQAVRSEGPDLIVLDIEMPSMNGLEICRQLKDSSQTCDIPIVFLSGSQRADVIREARAAGCQFYLAKPYDPNSLLTLVQTALHENFPW